MLPVALVSVARVSVRSVSQGRSKLFKSAGDGCGLFVNNKNDQYNDRRVQKV